MFCRSCLALALTLSLAACGTDESTQEPPESVQETPTEAAVSTEAVAGTYRLVAVNEEPLPARAGAVDECEVQLSEGSLTLTADAEYDLDVLARAVCDAEEDEEAQMMDRATSEGVYTVQGFELRFGPAVTPVEEGAYEDRLAEELVEDDLEEAMEDADATPELYDAGQFAGTGVLRDSLLTVRLDDELTTLSFVKE
jgi:hypothetical protein